MAVGTRASTIPHMAATILPTLLATEAAALRLTSGGTAPQSAGGGPAAPQMASGTGKVGGCEDVRNRCILWSFYAKPSTDLQGPRGDPGSLRMGWR